MSDPSVQVVKLIQDFNFRTTSGGVYGRRKYIEASALAGVAGATVENLPTVGDAWDNIFTAVRVSSVDITYLDNRPDCPRIYMVEYDTVPPDEAHFRDSFSQDENDLPLSIETSSEFITWEPDPKLEIAEWRWFNGLNKGNQVKQPLTRIINTATIRLQRVINRNFIDEFIPISFSCQGKTNDAVFLGFPRGTVIYTGCNAVEFQNQLGQKQYRAFKVDLTFVARTVSPRAGEVGPADPGPNGEADGWNYVLDEGSGEFAVAYNAKAGGGTDSLYGFEDFKTKLIRSASPQELLLANISDIIN